jgi:phage terminase large subunit-like protein
VSLNSDYLLNQYHKAKLTPSSLKEFFGFHLNMWVDKSKEEQFIEKEFIEIAYNNGIDIQLDFDFFKNKDVYLGLDMSKTDDLASLVILHYDREQNHFYAFPFIYMPSVPTKRIRNRGIDLTQWLLDGSITECRVKRIDEDMIFEDIVKINENCNIACLGHDGVNKSNIIPAVENLRKSNKQRIDCQWVEQGIYKITTATKLLDRIMAQEQLTFCNPCMKWQFGNCITRTDINNNIKLDKKISKDSIDSISALVNALELWRRDNENEYYKAPAEPIKISW